MAKLKTKHKELIVKELACFSSPTEIKEMILERFGLEVSSAQIAFYNPETPSSYELAEKWRELFRYTRDEYLDECVKVPIYHKAYRLHELQKSYIKASESGNIVLAIRILEQAAKESGGLYQSEPSEKVTPYNGMTLIQEVNKRIEEKILCDQQS